MPKKNTSQNKLKQKKKPTNQMNEKNRQRSGQSRARNYSRDNKDQ